MRQMDQENHRGQMRERAKKWRKRGDVRFKKQQQHNLLWQAQAEIFYPERADFTVRHSDGDERYDGIFAIEPQIFRRDMANAVGALMRPRGKPWFRLVAKPNHLMDNDAIMRWCEHKTEVHREIVYDKDAQFTRAMAQSDNDYVTFGNSIVSHTYNMNATGMLYKCLHLRDCAWAENFEGVVDEMHEKMQLELRQIAQLFGLPALPKEWARRLKDHPEEKHTIRRCVAPIDEYEYSREERQERATLAEYMSLYIAEGVGDDECALGESHFIGFPYTVRRWMTVSGEDYGRSPCTGVALAESRVLNSVQESLLTGIQLKNEPPLQARHDAVIGEPSLRPAAITYIDDDYDERLGDALKTLNVGEPRYGMEYAEKKQEALGNAFFQSILKWLPDKQLTAFEVSKRLETYVQEAAPIFEPMEAENAMMQEATFLRALEMGAYGQRLPDGTIEGVPEELQTAEMGFDFETPLSDALKEQKAAKGDELMARITSWEDIAPTMKDNFDLDEIARDIGEGHGQVNWMKKPEDRDAERAARQQEAEQQRAEQAAMAMVDTAARANPENLRMAEDKLKEIGVA